MSANLPKAILLALIIGTLVPEWPLQTACMHLLMALAFSGFAITLAFIALFSFARLRKKMANGGKPISLLSTTYLQIGLYAFFDCMLIALGHPLIGGLLLATKGMMLLNIKLINSVAK